jgi:hypothetical protein
VARIVLYTDNGLGNDEIAARRDTSSGYSYTHCGVDWDTVQGTTIRGRASRSVT